MIYLVTIVSKLQKAILGDLNFFVSVPYNIL